MNLIVLTSVDSTNNYLQQLNGSGMAEEGTVILALEQISGKGQRGNKWESSAGMGLYVSILLKPAFWPVEKQYFLNKAIAVGVAKYIESKTDTEVDIKWPNDILTEGKKIAGILVENNIRGHFISSVIVGIGVNLNQTQFTEQFECPPSSLKIETGISYDPETEATALFREVWNAYCQLIAGETHLIEEQYTHRLFRRGEKALFTKGEGLFYGVLKEVDNNGYALIEVDGTLISAGHPGTRFYLRS